MKSSLTCTWWNDLVIHLNLSKTYLQIIRWIDNDTLPTQNGYRYMNCMIRMWPHSPRFDCLDTRYKKLVLRSQVRVRVIDYHLATGMTSLSGNSNELWKAWPRHNDTVHDDYWIKAKWSWIDHKEINMFIDPN